MRGLIPAVGAMPEVPAVSEVEVGPLEGGESKYLRPMSMRYTQRGQRHRWDLIETHPSVGALIYNVDRDAFVLVRQFRPAFYAHLMREEGRGATPAEGDGLTYELCAGLCDKSGLSNAQVMAEEVHEETGYRVDASACRFVANTLNSTGTSGAPQALFYVEVTDAQREGDGGGVDSSEAIEVVHLPAGDVLAFTQDETKPKPAGLLFMLFYWLSVLKPQRSAQGPPTCM